MRHSTHSKGTDASHQLDFLIQLMIQEDITSANHLIEFIATQHKVSLTPAERKAHQRTKAAIYFKENACQPVPFFKYIMSGKEDLFIHEYIRHCAQSTFFYIAFTVIRSSPDMRTTSPTVHEWLKQFLNNTPTSDFTSLCLYNATDYQLQGNERSQQHIPLTLQKHYDTLFENLLSFYLRGIEIENDIVIKYRIDRQINRRGRSTGTLKYSLSDHTKIMKIHEHVKAGIHILSTWLSAKLLKEAPTPRCDFIALSMESLQELAMNQLNLYLKYHNLLQGVLRPTTNMVTGLLPKVRLGIQSLIDTAKSAYSLDADPAATIRPNLMERGILAGLSYLHWTIVSTLFEKCRDAIQNNAFLSQITLAYLFTCLIYRMQKTSHTTSSTGLLFQQLYVMLQLTLDKLKKSGNAFSASDITGLEDRDAETRQRLLNQPTNTTPVAPPKREQINSYHIAASHMLRIIQKLTAQLGQPAEDYHALTVTAAEIITNLNPGLLDRYAASISNSNRCASGTKLIGPQLELRSQALMIEPGAYHAPGGSTRVRLESWLSTTGLGRSTQIIPGRP